MSLTAAAAADVSLALVCQDIPNVVLWLPTQLLPESVGRFKNPSGTGYICP